MATDSPSLPPALNDARQQAGRFWQTRAPRERQLIAVMGVSVAILLVWLILVQPALRTLREAPVELDRLDQQMQQMQLAASEMQGLRAASPVPTEQASTALRAATAQLGSTAKLAIQGDRAVLTFTGVPGDALRGWLGEARSAARARPLEAQMVKAATGYSGSITVSLGGRLVIRRKRNRQLWAPTVAGSGWSESTLAEQAWEIERGAAVRWAIAGVLFGLLVGLVLFAPAAWLAKAVASATNQRLLLADARGTIWSGSAVPILTGGADSRDASYLPGRLEWSLSPRLYGVELAARQDCCISGTLKLQIRPGFGRIKATYAPPPGAANTVGQWPSAWLGGLGTPWNTLQLGGTARIASPGFSIEQVEGRWRLDGKLDLELEAVSSRLTTLDTLGSYRVTLTGGASENSATLLSLTTTDGPLQLIGSGTWGPAGVKFRGEARSAAVDEAALSNLLNIIGRRDGARSIISIG